MSMLYMPTDSAQLNEVIALVSQQGRPSGEMSEREELERSLLAFRRLSGLRIEFGENDDFDLAPLLGILDSIRLLHSSLLSGIGNAFIRRAATMAPDLVSALDMAIPKATRALGEVVEALDDYTDGALAQQAINDWQTSGDPALSLEETKKALGL